MGSHYQHYPDQLYRYIAGFRLEGVSRYIAEQKGWVKIVFSNRNRFRLDLLQSYVTHIIEQRKHQIYPVFDVKEIVVRNTGQLKMLQIADACAGAVGAAFNPDLYGNYNPFYLQILQSRFYRHGGKTLGYGLRLLPEDTSGQSYFAEYPFVEDLLKETSRP